MTLPYLNQLLGVRAIERFGGRALLGDEMGLGKAQPLDAKILTPHGWKKMGELNIGDNIIGYDGKPTRIVAIHPQGKQKVFRITFRDGAFAECTDEHLWYVHSPAQKHRGLPGKIITLRQMREKLKDGAGNAKYFVPITDAVAFPYIKVPLHPYLLGYLIANGSLTTKTPMVTIPDKETVRRIERLIPAGTKLLLGSGEMNYRITKGHYIGGNTAKNPLTVILRELNLMGHAAQDKRIPRMYRYNSIKTRTQLLQGLMDGDGSVTVSSNTVGYSTASKCLALDAQELVESLGGIARLNCKKEPKYTYKGEIKIGRPSYSLTIALPNTISPFKLSRKANNHKPRTKYLPSRAVTNIESIGTKECQCITIENENGLYLTNHHIVTHNSLTSLLFAIRHPDVRPIVIVCQASLRWNWENEVKAHTGMRTEVIEGTKPDPGWSTMCPIVIINYDILTKWLPLLKSLNPQLVIIDECQALGNRLAKRTKAVMSLCEGVPHVLALSGTPVVNRPAELWPILHILRPDKFRSFFPFAMNFCGAKKNAFGWDFTGATNLKELHRILLDTCLVRRRQADVLPDLPDLKRTVVPVGLSDPAEYEEAVGGFLRWLAGRQSGRVRGQQRAEGLAKINHLRGLVGRLKLPAVERWISDRLKKGGKLILFGYHLDVIRSLYEKNKHRSVYVAGSVKGRRRQQAFDQFTDTKTTRMLVGQIRAAGAGWNGRGVSAIAFAEFDWTPGAHTQGEKRIHGLGRGVPGKAAEVFYLVAEGTVEEKLLRTVQAKQKNINSILDGEKGGDELPLFDLFCNVLKGE